MSPRTLMTPEEVEKRLRGRLPQEYCWISHYVDVFGNCPCGRFKEESKK